MPHMSVARKRAKYSAATGAAASSISKSVRLRSLSPFACRMSARPAALSGSPDFKRH